MSVLRGRRKPGTRWRQRDWLALLALTRYEADLCTGCGQPRTYAADADAEGRYSVAESTCWGCSTLERHQRNRKPTPGALLAVQPDAGLTYAMHNPIHVPPVHT